MFTSGSLIRTYFTVNGDDFCVDTALIMQRNGRYDFETMFFRMVKGDVGFDDSFDELHASSFEEAEQNHHRMVDKYTIPFRVIPCADDYSGVDRVLKELDQLNVG